MLTLDRSCIHEVGVKCDLDISINEQLLSRRDKARAEARIPWDLLLVIPPHGSYCFLLIDTGCSKEVDV